MASWKTYLQAVVYIALLFFLFPIRIKKLNEEEKKFEEYLQTFNKTYDDPKIYQRKLQAFQMALEDIDFMNTQNRSNSSARYGLTKYSDMLPEEFLQNILQANMSKTINSKKKKKHDKKKKDKRDVIPRKIDWRLKNAVTKVHDQGNCGACWAYSTVQTMESMYAIKNKLQDFSVQEVIDCAGYTNDGCNGGDVCTLLHWMKDTKFTLHLNKEYSSTKNTCKMTTHGVQIDDFICDHVEGSEHVILELLAVNGPVAVAINAQTWQNYIGGVIEYHCDGDPKNLNHAVQIVGYDLTSDIPHYIVRNSWGEDFGDKGYLYIAVKKNMCGLANEVAALRVL